MALIGSLNSSGGTITGDLDMATGALKFKGTVTTWKQSFPFNGSNYDGATTKTWHVSYPMQSSILYEGQIDIGTDNLGTTNRYFYVQYQTGMYHVGSLVVELFNGSWNYGQSALYFRSHVRTVNGTVATTTLEDAGGMSYTVGAKAFNHNTGSNMYHRLAIYCPHGRNAVQVRIWTTMPFDYNSTPSMAYTDTNPIA